MHRIDSDGAVGVIPTVEAPGTAGYFSQGNPGVGQQATVVSADWCNSVQEELAGVVEEAGLTLDKEDNTQLLTAIQSLIRNPTIRSIIGSDNVDVDDDVLIIDATLGNVNLVLPAISLSPTREKVFIRADATSNTVTITRGSTDTIMGQTTQTIDTQYGFLRLLPLATVWYQT